MYLFIEIKVYYVILLCTSNQCSRYSMVKEEYMYSYVGKEVLVRKTQ